MKLGEGNRKTAERSLPGNLVRQQVRSYMRNRAHRILQLIFPGRVKQKGLGPQPPTLYQPPRLARLTPEQAKLKLLGHLISLGDQGAKDLLGLLFHEPVVLSATREPENLPLRG